MKKIELFIVSATLLFYGCKKSGLSGESADKSQIENAKSYFNQEYESGRPVFVKTNSKGSHKSPRLNGPRTVRWDQAIIFQSDDFKAVLVPVEFNKSFLVRSNISGKAIYSINDLTRLCIYKDSSGSFHAQWLSFFPDSSYAPGRRFSGMAFVDSWQGNPVTKYKFEKNGAILEWDGKNVSADQPGIKAESVQTINSYVIETCYTILGYNYSAADPGGNYYWSESGGCTYRYIESFAPARIGGGSSPGVIGAIGSGGGGARTIPTYNLNVAGGNNIIGNIVDYMKCFTNVGGTDHLFQVEVCVSQPVPGSRQSWGLSLSGGSGSSAGLNPVNVGHSFLKFTETTISSTITRNVGFYPKTVVNPRSPVDQGQLNNDEQHGYNISLTITLTNSQFFNMLAFLAQNYGANYDLNSFNCSTFVWRVLYTGDVILPSTIGNWFGGSGNNPGDLGEDIRAMNLSSNMTRNSSFSSHPNLGFCF